MHCLITLGGRFTPGGVLDHATNFFSTFAKGGGGPGPPSRSATVDSRKNLNSRPSPHHKNIAYCPCPTHLSKEIHSVELGVCPMQLFQFWSRDVHPVQNLLLCTKFHENPIIFTARRVCIARTMPWQDVCQSVCLSVCHTPVLSLNGYTYPQSFFTIR